MFRKESILDINGVLDLKDWDNQKNPFVDALKIMYVSNDFRPEYFSIDESKNAIYFYSKKYFKELTFKEWMSYKERGEAVKVEGLETPMFIRNIEERDKSVNGLIKIITDYFKYCDKTEVTFYSNKEFDKIINWRMTLMGEDFKYIRFSCELVDREV